MACFHGVWLKKTNLYIILNKNNNFNIICTIIINNSCNDHKTKTISKTYHQNYYCVLMLCKKNKVYSCRMWTYVFSPNLLLFSDGKCLKHETTCENSPCPEGYECVSGFEEDKHSCVCTGAAEVKCSGNSELISLSEKTVSSKRHITGAD